ncbi:MAG: ATP-binding protein, partial [Deltaproteobacteria bacterium]|nr:ATP-binding protein [Deltaproteobacteria bacterium]
MSKMENGEVDEKVVIEHLRELRFKTCDEDLKALFQEKIDGEIGPMLVAIARIAEVERAERQVRNLDSRTRIAALGKCISLDGFDWTHPKAIDRGLYEQLLSLDFLDDSYNVLFRGQSGTGKTTLAKIVGFKALQEGRTVRFTSLPSMVSELLSQESIPAFTRKLRKFTGPDLLIIDEVGYLPCKNDA